MSRPLLIAFCGLLLVRPRGLVLGVLLMAMVAQGGFQTIKDSWNGLRSRSYFGIYTVRTYEDDRIRTLTHGSTLHGEQSLDPKLRDMPLSYYGPGSGAGIVFSHAKDLFGAHPRVGVVGLGTGTLACFNQPGEEWQIFEIDPAVLRLSTNGTFTYLPLCAPQAKVTLGDARLELAKTPRGSFDLLAIDAFSSDSVPMHLFTHEAFGVYLDALSPHGVMMVHISNNFIDLEPALSAELRARGLAAALRDDNPQADTDYWATSWVAVSRDPAQIERIKALDPDAPWRALGPPAPSVWRDDYASFLPYVTWHNFLGMR